MSMLRDDWRAGNTASMLLGFGHGLVSAALNNPQVLALSADLADSVGFGEFAKKIGAPRFIEVGVAEQNLVTVATGLEIGRAHV